MIEVQRIGCLRDQPVEWRETLIRGDRFSVAALWSAQEGYRMGVTGDGGAAGSIGTQVGRGDQERPSLNSERPCHGDRRSGPQSMKMVDRVKGSALHRLKELRPGSTGGSEIRILFAFDPASRAVLLVAGDKASN